MNNPFGQKENENMNPTSTHTPNSTESSGFSPSRNPRVAAGGPSNPIIDDRVLKEMTSIARNSYAYGQPVSLQCARDVLRLIPEVRRLRFHLSYLSAENRQLSEQALKFTAVKPPERTVLDHSWVEQHSALPYCNCEFCTWARSLAETAFPKSRSPWKTLWFPQKSESRFRQTLASLFVKIKKLLGQNVPAGGTSKNKL